MNELQEKRQALSVDHTENIISFCTGYGGIELGLHRVIENLRTVCYVEIETFAIANLVAKIEQGKMDAAPIWSDIKTFPARIFRDKIHGIVGGYPCQPFSAAGKRKGKADPRHLWPYIEKHIRTIRPVWCFFENVSGHLTLGFDEVFKSLRDLHYKVEAGLFTAAEVGAPHKRERLFILAYSTRGDDRGTSRQIQSKNEQQAEKRPKRRPTESGRAGELANPIDHGHQGQGCRINGKTDGIQGENRQARSRSGESIRTTRLGRKRAANGVSDKRTIRPSKEQLANTEHKGQHKRNIYQTRQVAGPNQKQYEWEEPRTVKPGMGRTVDGFKSRVDELRLLGNGVVPAQAELAFRTLWDRI